jgi:anti-sigma B factor antagonist
LLPNANTKLELTPTVQDDVSILELNGRLDVYTSPRVNDWIEITLANRPPKMVINLSGVDFLESLAIGVLVKGMKRCREQSGDLVLCSVRRQVGIIFQLTGLNKAFGIYETQEEAVRAFTPS